MPRRLPPDVSHAISCAKTALTYLQEISKDELPDLGLHYGPRDMRYHAISSLEAMIRELLVQQKERENLLEAPTKPPTKTTKGTYTQQSYLHPPGEEKL